ncbi:MAG: pyridoxamine 5'-phosphate oxidase family protein [Bacteroidales bacterium]|nr:pyridoxamine 5'-phosphate oxidase family protein [Bacteroidales bacterium]
MRKKNKEVTDIQEIERIISRADVCRIAFADMNTPYIVTMNFGYSGGEKKYLWFHCANEGRKLDLIRKNNYVCFEMDTDHDIVEGSLACDFSMKYSSIVGYGYISIVDDPDEKKKGLNQIMFHYTGKKDFSYKPEILAITTILRLEITELTGKHK